MKTILLFTLFACSVSFAQSNVDMNDLQNSKDIDEMYKACQKSTAIWNEVKPVNAVPAVIGYESGRTSVGDLCYQVTQIKGHMNKLKTLSSKITNEGLNKEGAAAKLAMTGYAYMQNQSTLDDKTNKTPAVVASSRAKRKYRSFYKKITGISATDAATDPTKGERIAKYEEDFDRLSTINQKRQALDSKLHCKDGANEDIKARFEKELLPLQDAQEILAETRQQHYQELMSVSSKFRRERDMEGFRAELKTIEATAIMLVPNDKELEVDAAEYYQASDGSKKLRAIKKKITVQSFTVYKNNELLKNFEAKWDKNWRDNISDNLDSLIEAFSDGDSCADSLFKKNSGGSLDKAADYQANALKRCKARKNFNPKSAGGYFADNFKLYIKNYQEQKDVEAKMLSLESEMLREPIAPTKNQMKSVVSKDKDPCMSELTYSDMVALNKKLAATEAEYKALAAEARMKKNAILQNRYERKVQEQERVKRMNQIKDQEKKERSRELNKLPRSLSY